MGATQVSGRRENDHEQQAEIHHQAAVPRTAGRLAAGGEIGRSMPLRFGVRGGQMPFGPGLTAPTEFGVAGGIGRAFAQGRAVIDLGVERLQREGDGLTERVWSVLVGLTVRP